MRPKTIVDIQGSPMLSIEAVASPLVTVTNVHS